LYYIFWKNLLDVVRVKVDGFQAILSVVIVMTLTL